MTCTTHIIWLCTVNVHAMRIININGLYDAMWTSVATQCLEEKCVVPSAVFLRSQWSGCPSSEQVGGPAGDMAHLQAGLHCGVEMVGSSGVRTFVPRAHQPRELFNVCQVVINHEIFDDRPIGLSLLQAVLGRCHQWAIRSA